MHYLTALPLGSKQHTQVSMTGLKSRRLMSGPLTPGVESRKRLLASPHLWAWGSRLADELPDPPRRPCRPRWISTPRGSASRPSPRRCPGANAPCS